MDHIRGPSNAGVDQDRAGTGVLDHESVDRYVVEAAEACQVEANDLHR
jgi:hypothetical protein